ncbi:Natural resistance-associated macrophage protein, partial [Haemophilus influenzae]
KQAY